MLLIQLSSSSSTSAWAWPSPRSNVRHNLFVHLIELDKAQIVDLEDVSYIVRNLLLGLTPDSVSSFGPWRKPILSFIVLFIHFPRTSSFSAWLIRCDDARHNMFLSLCSYISHGPCKYFIDADVVSLVSCSVFLRFLCGFVYGFVRKNTAVYSHHVVDSS